MSGGDSSGEKTEEATPHKLREARKKGQVAKSTDFTTGIVFAFSAAVLYAMGPGLIASLQDFVIRCFKIGTLGPSHSATLGLVMEGGEEHRGGNGARHVEQRDGSRGQPAGEP